VDTEKYDYKKNWLDSLIKQLKNLSKKNENIILAGDFNIIPAAEDVYNVKSFEDDALYRLEIRKKLREIINLGFNDIYRHFNEDKEGYTFWDYMRGAWQKNNGMRIDHFLASNSILDHIKSVNINKDPRGREKPSDHTPIEIKLA
jgi:exodeoxyribonuclease-3